jgi:integrase
MAPLFNLSHDRPSETLLDQDSARTALDELFTLAGKYNSSDAYLELMRFVGRFRFYSPFNAMFGNFFKEACVKAGILDKSGHGVRKAAATEAADNGATHAQLNSIFGWKGDKMAYLYTESADRKRLARSLKLSRSKKGTSKPPPDEKVGVLNQKVK